MFDKVPTLGELRSAQMDLSSFCYTILYSVEIHPSAVRSNQLIYSDKSGKLSGYVVYSPDLVDLERVTQLVCNEISSGEFCIVETPALYTKLGGYAFLLDNPSDGQKAVPVFGHRIIREADSMTSLFRWKICSAALSWLPENTDEDDTILRRAVSAVFRKK